MNVVVVKFLMQCTKFHCNTFNLGLSMRNLSFIPQFLNFYDVRLNHVLILILSVLPIAQLVERQTVVLKVVGSNPAWQV